MVGKVIPPFEIKLDLGEGINALKVEATTRASLFAMYENGDEDHQILMKLTYEVI